MESRVKRVAGASIFVLAAIWVWLGCSPEIDPESDPLQPAAESMQVDGPRIVVLISLDTVRADHLGVYGYERFTSPVLDQLGREGVVFEDASATAPWTLPSHASILTGLYPNAHRVVSMKTQLPKAVPTLASVLAGRGWGTAAVVNSTWLHRDTYGLTRDFGKYLFVEEVAERRAPNTWITDQAIEWLEATRTDPKERLFLFVHYYDAHSDYASEPAYEKLFVGPYRGIADGTTWQLTRANLDDSYLAMCRENFQPEKCTFGSAEKPWVVDASVSKLTFDDADARHLSDLYDAGIRQLDTELGRLFGWLRSAGLSDETLLVVTSDHGEEFMEHGRVDHFLPTWQEVLHVPLIWTGPGIPAGVRVGQPVSSVDVAPTILAQLGIEPPRAMDGLDLSSSWRSDERSASGFDERFLYGEGSGGLSYELVAPGFFPIFRSVRQGRYKLVSESKGKASADALYDLQTDPREQHDVSDSHPEIAARLRDELQRRHTIDPAAAEEDAVELSAEEIERLRELGYLR